VANKDPDYWRARAREARAQAETMSMPTPKRELLTIAVAYERLAEHAERTAGRKGTRDRS